MHNEPKRYEWDDDKNDANRRKHRIDFAAMERFIWNYALGPDFQIEDGEEREFWVGPIDSALYAVAITMRGDMTRVISLRDASRAEKRAWRREFQNDRQDP